MGDDDGWGLGRDSVFIKVYFCTSLRIKGVMGCVAGLMSDCWGDVYNVRGDGACFYRAFGMALQNLGKKNWGPNGMEHTDIAEMKQVAINQLELSCRDENSFMVMFGIIDTQINDELGPAFRDTVTNLKEGDFRDFDWEMKKDFFFSALRQSKLRENDCEVFQWMMLPLAKAYSVDIVTFMSVANAGRGGFVSDETMLEMEYTMTYTGYGTPSVDRRVYLVSAYRYGAHWGWTKWGNIVPSEFKQGNRYGVKYHDPVARVSCMACGLPMR